MPLPWKKARISRISRLMSDLHSSKPMVVQTGFPTSLVDLLVKNSDRLKKSVSKKKKKPNRSDAHQYNHQQPCPVDDEVPAAGEIPPVNSNNDDSKRTDNLDVFEPAEHRFEMNHKSNKISNGCCSGDGRGVLYGVSVVFVAVVWALVSIKILTLGITMSACVLICFEYIGKHISCSCSRVFDLFVCKSVGFKTEIMAEAREEDRIEKNSPAEEIEVVEFEVRSDTAGRVEADNEGRGMNLNSDAVSVEKVQIRRRKSRDMMKKVVPKKWRKAKISKEAEEIAGRHEEKAEGSNWDAKERSTEIPGDLQLKEGENKGAEQLPATTVYREEAEMKRGSCFVLVVALAGLVGGRIMALGLTVVSCAIIHVVIVGRRNQRLQRKKSSL